MSKLQSIAERILYILESPNLSREEKLDYLTKNLKDLDTTKQNTSSLWGLKKYIEKSCPEDTSKKPTETKINNIYILFFNNDIIIAELINYINNDYRYYKLIDYFTKAEVSDGSSNSEHFKKYRRRTTRYDNIAYCVPLIELLPFKKYNPESQVTDEFINQIYDTINQYIQEHPLFYNETFLKRE